MIDGPVWDDDAWVALPSLQGDASADVCVVGLGGSGLACVHELLRLGQWVVGVDAGHVGGGAAGRNGGFLLAGLASFHHVAAASLGRARARDLYRLTLAEMDRMAEETPEWVRRVGSLRIASSPEERADCELQLAAMRADALPVERYEGAEGWGLLFPADGAFHPLARCRSLARRAGELGARLYEQSRAESIVPGEVRTAAGSVRARHVIVMVDGNLERVFPELEGRVRSARLQMLATAPVLVPRFPRPVYARWGYDYWQQIPGGRVVLGGFRDVGGEAEWTDDATPSAPVQHALERYLRDALLIGEPITHRWAATVGYTESGLPLTDEVRPGIWAVGGYCGTGNVLGALFGRRVAQVVARAAGVAELRATLDPNP